MNSKKTKILFRLIVGFVIASVLSLSLVMIDTELFKVSASDEYTWEDYRYTYEDGSVMITKYKGECDGLLEIPGEIDGDTVTAIDSYAFSGNGTITEVIVPDSVKSIRFQAFAGCENLKRIDLGKIKELYSQVFLGCFELKEITIPNTLLEASSTYDGDSAFVNSGLEKATIEDGMVNLPDDLFSGCDTLKEVIIPESVINISEQCFKGCKSLEEISLHEGISIIERDAFSGCKTLLEIKIPSSVKEIDIFAFQNCSKLHTIDLGSIQTIGYLAFDGCVKLKEVFVPKTLTEVVTTTSGEGAFAGSALETVEFETGTTIIPDGVCGYASNLKAIKIPDTVESIGSGAFQGCQNLEEIDFPLSLITIESDAFAECKNLKAIELPDLTKSVGLWAFRDCSMLEGLNLNKVEKLGYGAFENCVKLKNIYIPKTFKSVIKNLFSSDGPFLGSGVESVVFEDGLEEVSAYIFSGASNLKYITIPNSAKKIGSCAFMGCTSLEEIIIPRGVITVSEEAFSGCTRLRKISIPDTAYEFYDVLIDSTELEEVIATENSTIYNYFKNQGVNVIGTPCTHPYNSVLEAVPATCTTTGLTEGKKCLTCGLITDEQEVTSKLKHISDNGAVIKNPTCSVPGTQVYKCTLCKETIKTESIHATGNHNSNITIPGKSATYASTGLTAGKKCSVCGKITVAQKTIAKLTLGKVSGLKAKSVKVAKSSEIKLVWNKVSGAEEYEVYQYVNKKWKKIKTTSSTSYTVKKLKADKEYKFKVRAVVDGASGAYSSVLKVKTIPETTSKLTLKAGKKQLTASWKSVSDISGYEVQYSTSKKFTKKTTKTVNAKKSSKKTTIKKLSKGKKYYVRVRTYKTVNGKKIYSNWSTVKNVKVK